MILSKGSDEIYKGVLHAYLAGVLTVIGSYNLAAYLTRKDRHLLTNAIIYTVAVGWEIHQTWTHFSPAKPVPTVFER